MADDFEYKGKKFLVWHIPNMPREPFEVHCETLHDAVTAINVLAYYDLYLGEHVISDNAQGIMVWDDGDWEDIEYLPELWDETPATRAYVDSMGWS